MDDAAFEDGPSGPANRSACNVPVKKGLITHAGFVLTSATHPMKTLIAILLLISPATLKAQSAPGQNTTGQGGQQEQQGDTPTRDGLWDGRMNGGNYIVRCNSIIALSKHEYISDGVARVVEVNLTLNSAQVVRFYFLEAAKVEGSSMVNAGQQALDRARGMVEQAAGRVSSTLTDPKVVKNYPASTHAHTVEFVIKEEARLNSLFQSLERGFRSGQGRIWKE